MPRLIARRRVRRITVGAGSTTREDVLAAEEPFEIRVSGRSLAVTMRTPGNDLELAAGFLVSEGVIHSRDDFASAIFCAGDHGENAYNVLDVTLGPHVEAPAPSLAREFFTTSSCGICGKSSIDAVRTTSAYDVRKDALQTTPELLATLPDRLRSAQSVFEKTGGLHAAGLFDGTTGELLVAREDVGRHNAVDKVIGWALLQSALPARSTILMVSGRASFELTQKAVMAGIPVLAAISAPSSLAAELATESGMTLVGFLRGNSMVVYAGGQRISDTKTVAVERTGESGSAA